MAFYDSPSYYLNNRNRFYDYPKNFQPQENTRMTSEGAAKALDFLRKQTEKQITVKPVPANKLSPDLGGYFNPTEPGGGLYNSPQDSQKRTVFLAPNASYDILIHEMGHARDPDLRKLYAKERSFDPTKIISLKTPTERLKYFAEHFIDPRVKAEVEANAYSGFQLSRFARENPELSINDQAARDNPWFKEYPASYIERGLNKFYQAETDPGIDPSVYRNIDYQTAYPTHREFQGDGGLKALKLGLDPDFQSMEQSIIDRNLQTVDERLNPYQKTPNARRPQFGTPGNYQMNLSN